MPVGPGRLEPLMRDWGTQMAALAGLPEGRLAEPYQRIVTL